jgi:hypothetical protein
MHEESSMSHTIRFKDLFFNDVLPYVISNAVIKVIQESLRERLDPAATPVAVVVRP